MVPLHSTSRRIVVGCLGCKISEGTLYRSREQCFAELAPVEALIEQQIGQAEVLHCDETGMRVQGKLWWLHVASTDGLTFYFVHTKRGKAAMDAMAILPEYDGTSLHDGLKSDEQYDCDHALCNAHHLRELAFITALLRRYRKGRYAQPWAEEMGILLRDLKQQVDAAKALGETALSGELRQGFEDRYQTLIVAGLAANPSPDPPPPDAAKSRGRPKQSPAKNLLDCLQHHQAQVLAFMVDFRRLRRGQKRIQKKKTSTGS
ncbi:IS66 family transposase [Phormidesmis priestleyi]